MIRTLAAFSLAITVNLASASEPIVFPKTTIDIGMVVTDLDASVAFYTDGIGFKESDGFQVDSTLAGSAGLTDNKPLDVRVLVLGNDKTATKLKLMQIAKTSPRSGDNDFIHSHTGFRYLTIIIADTSAALSRLKKNWCNSSCEVTCNASAKSCSRNVINLRQRSRWESC
jgi:hypothetical protein